MGQQKEHDPLKVQMMAFSSPYGQNNLKSSYKHFIKTLCYCISN